MRPVRIVVAVLIMAAAVFTAASCQDIASPLEDFHWQLIQYGSPGNMKSPLPDTEITVLFSSSDKTVTGSGGVNSFNGIYEVDHLTLKITELFQTLISGGPEKDAQEKEFMVILAKADRFEMERGNLTIYSGANRLIFSNTDSTIKPPNTWGE